MIRKGIQRLATIPISVIILINLVLKLAVFFDVAPWNKETENTKIVVSDAKNYEWIAENLVKAGTFAPPKDTVDFSKFSEYQNTGTLFWYADALRLPAYPVFIAFFYKIFGIKPFIALLGQILFSLLSIYFTYKICLLFGQKEVGVLAALLFSIDIHSIYVSNLLLTETVFVTLFITGLYYFFKCIKHKTITDIALSSLFLGFAALTRGVLSAYPLIIVAVILLCIKGEKQWKLKAMVTHVLIMGLLLGAWSYRNHKVYNSWQLTTQGGYAIAMYNASTLKAKLTHCNVDSVRVQFQQQADSAGFKQASTPFEKTNIYTSVGMNYLKKHKMAYLTIHAEGALNMYFSIGNVSLAEFLGWNKTQVQEKFAEVSTGRIMQNFTSNITTTLLGLMILLIMAIQYFGVLMTSFKWRQFDNPVFFLLGLLTLIYFTGITGVYGMYRYKLPLVPFMCIAAAYYYNRFANLKQRS